MQHHYFPIHLLAAFIKKKFKKKNIIAINTRVLQNFFKWLAFRSIFPHTSLAFSIIPYLRLDLLKAWFNFFTDSHKWSGGGAESGSQISTSLHSSLPMHRNSNVSQDKTLNLLQRLKITTTKTHNKTTGEIFLENAIHSFLLPIEKEYY